MIPIILSLDEECSYWICPWCGCEDAIKYEDYTECAECDYCEGLE